MYKRQAQVRNIADVTTAVARGDLSRKITVDVKGEIPVSYTHLDVYKRQSY